MYRKFREDPASVDRSWHEFLAGYSPDAAGDAAALEAWSDVCSVYSGAYGMALSSCTAGVNATISIFIG